MHHLVGVAEVAKMLGVSRQRITQLMEQYPDFPQPEAVLVSGRVWARSAVEAWLGAHPDRRPGRPTLDIFRKFTDGTRLAILAAQESARALRQPYISTGHLLLGLLGAADSAAARVLADLGCTYPIVREQVTQVLPPDKDPHDPKEQQRLAESLARQLPFTPYAKRALELAAISAFELDDTVLAPEHLLLGVLRETDDVATVAMRELDIDADKVKKAIKELRAKGGAE